DRYFILILLPQGLRQTGRQRINSSGFTPIFRHSHKPTAMHPKITLKVIAKEFGVSISTVSKALKNSPELGKETKERIQAFAAYYNYRPNTTALSLKNQNTETIGVILPDIVHHFFSSVIKGIERVANTRGYKVIICLSKNSLEKEALNLGLLADGSIEGFI